MAGSIQFHISPQQKKSGEMTPRMLETEMFTTCNNHTILQPPSFNKVGRHPAIQAAACDKARAGHKHMRGPPRRLAKTVVASARLHQTLAKQKGVF